MPVRRGSAEQVVGGRRERVLVGPAVHRGIGQLLGCRVVDRSHGHVGAGQPAGLVHRPGDPEIRQQDPPPRPAGEQDVGWFDVAVQQPTPVRVVQRGGDRADDLDRLLARHARGITLPDQPPGVGAVDEVHRDPQLAVDLAAVVHADDVRVEEGRREVRLAVEALTELRIRRDLGGQDLHRVAARQSGVLGQIDLTHSPRPQRPDDPVARKGRARHQRHNTDVTARYRQVSPPATAGVWAPRRRSRPVR